MLRFFKLNVHRAKNRLLYSSTNEVGSKALSPNQYLIAYVHKAKTFCSVPDEVPVLALKLLELDKEAAAAAAAAAAASTAAAAAALQGMKYEEKLRIAEAFYQKSLSFLTQRLKNI